MLMWRVAAAAALGLAAAGCGKGTTETRQVVRAAPGATGLPAAVPHPVRRPGLWAQTTQFGGVTQTSRICLDAAMDAKMGLQAKPADTPCAQAAVTPVAGGGWAFSSTCGMGEAGTMVSHGVASGDLTAHYRVDVETTTTGSAAPQMNGTRKFSIDARWLGPCPADMKPGDVMLANGMRIAAGGAPAR
jgi:hypothetical protein